VGFQAAWILSVWFASGLANRLANPAIRGNVFAGHDRFASQRKTYAMRSFSELRKVVQSWKEQGYGVLEVLCVVNRYLPQKLLSIKPRYVMSLPRREAPVVGQPDEGIRLGTVADVLNLARLENKPREFLRRFAANDLCVVAEADGRIVGYEWAHSGGPHYEQDLDYSFRAEKRAVWCYDAYVDANCRKQGAWRRIQSGIIAFMNDSAEFKAIVHYDNDISLKAHLRYGFHVSEQFVFLALLGIKIVFHKAPSARSLHRLYRRLSLPATMRFRPRARPAAATPQGS
jgi:hypothetical protein